MTNPISKAIVKAAVAMGYGKKSDYKGSSVADVLEKFAAIAKDKGNSGGSSGGGVMVVNLHVEQDGGKTGRVNTVCDKTADEMFQAIETKSVVLKVESSETESATCMHIIAADNTDGYMFLACDVEGNRVRFTSMTADGYPSFSA